MDAAERWNDGQAEDPRPGSYYATARSETGKTAFLAGPYPTHAEALDVVRPAKRLVEERCSWRQTAGVGYGTCRIHDVAAADLPRALFTDAEVGR